MAEKISSAAWTAFAKKRELGDDALVKALAKLDKTDASKPDAHAEALADVMAQLKKLSGALPKLKLPAAEAKEVSAKVAALLQEAEKMHGGALAAQKQADAADDEEADSPVLLTTKLVPLLRELRKGEAHMPTLICTAGKDAAVLIMRRPIAPARRKLLAEFIGGTGPKYIGGECLYERNALTFVVEGAAAGLAKKLRAALLSQTALRLKVRVRGDDGAEDEDGEEEAEAAAEALAEVAGTTATATAAAPETPPPAPPVPPTAEGAAAFNARLAALLPKIKAATAEGHARADAIKLKAAEAGTVARGRDWDAANRLLDEAEALLAERGAAPAAAAAAPSAPRTPAAAIVYTQTRLAWGATRKKVQAELAKLEKAIVADYKDVEFPQLEQGVRKLDRVLEMFDESLDDALDAALNAADPAEKMRHHDEARAIIARYQGFLAGDALVRELDANPFVPIAVQSTLSTSLATLAAKIV